MLVVCVLLIAMMTEVVVLVASVFDQVLPVSVIVEVIQEVVAVVLAVVGFAYCLLICVAGLKYS